MEIVIVGAGPRGLSTAERLINLANDDQVLNITLYDPYNIGGRVWDDSIEQNRLFLMNTVTEQITLFSDESIENGGESISGPNMYQWIQNEANDFLFTHAGQFNLAYSQEIQQLGANDFSTRGLMGVYATWFYEWLQNRLNANQTLKHVRKNVNDVQKVDDGYTVILDDGQQVSANAIVMGLGHSKASLTEEEQALQDYAKVHQLTYVAPTHPSEVDLSVLKPGEKVAVRGLGLSFFDYLADFSIARGGQFIRQTTGELAYIKSGKEPIVYAGSRSGVPLHARGVNQKEASELYQPQFFTSDNLNQLKQINGGRLAYDDFSQLLVKELTYKHLLNRLALGELDLNYDEIEAFKQDLLVKEDLLAVAQNYGIDTTLANLDLEAIKHPIDNYDSSQDYQAFMQNYLIRDITDARLGNKDALFAGAFDILRDIRDIIRHEVNSEAFSKDDYQRFLREFGAFNVLVSVGPPLERVEQLLALMEAGIVTLMAPDVQVIGINGGFQITDSIGQEYDTTALVEARLDNQELAQNINPIVANLRNKGWLKKPNWLTSSGETVGITGAAVNRKTYELLDETGEILPHLYLFGTTIEGFEWFMTVIPRPGVNTVIIREAAWIAQHILAG